MLWILVIAIGIAVGISWAREDGWTWLAYVGYPIISTLAAGFLGFLVAMLLSITPVNYEEPQLVSSAPIYAMQDNLGTGGYYRAIDTEGKYWVTMKNEKGFFVQSYPMEDQKTYIKNDNNPRVEKYKLEAASCFRTFLLTKSWFNKTEV